MFGIVLALPWSPTTAFPSMTVAWCGYAVIPDIWVLAATLGALGFFMVHLMDAESYWHLESLGDEAILWAFSHVS